MNTIEKDNVAVVITTYNDYKKTLACLESVHKQVDSAKRIVVVDNGSENNMVDRLLSAWKELAKKYNLQEPVEVYSDDVDYSPLVLIRLSENEGYAAAVNHALRMLFYDKDCKAFWLLHNDTLPLQYALSALIRHTQEEENKEIVDYHIIGSTILHEDLELLQCAGGGTFSSILGKVRLYEEDVLRFSMPERENTIKNINFIYGASVLIRREVFENIGLLSEKFFLFFEDVEFSIRAQQAGYRLNWAPGAMVSHIGPVPGRATPVRSFNQLPINDYELPQQADYYNIRNRFYLLKKLHPYTFFLSLLTLPLPLSIRWFKGQKSRFHNVIQAVKDGIKA